MISFYTPKAEAISLHQLRLEIGDDFTLNSTTVFSPTFNLSVGRYVPIYRATINKADLKYYRAF